VLHLLRVMVPDRPGSLGALATAIGDAGGDIAAIDVVERSSTGAVDDVLVELAPTAATKIHETLGRLPGVVIESLEPFHEGDELSDELDALDGLPTSAGRALAAVVRMAPAVLRARWAIVLDVTDRAAVTKHASAGAPRARWAALPWLPLTSPATLDADPAWVPHAWGERPEVAAAPISLSDGVLLAIRPRGPHFRASELTRLANLAALAGLAAHGDTSGRLHTRAVGR
jgi:hypothetical protein